MRTDRAILKRWKMHIYGLLVLVVVQSLALPLLNAFLKEFIQQDSFRSVAFLLIVAVCASVDLYFLVNRIILLRYLLSKQPVKCKLEDIFLIGYKDDKKTRYSPFLIVRSTENQKLYITYDKYSLLEYASTFNYSDRSDIRCTVRKSDGTPIRLGDCVNMYLLKTVSVPVSVDRSRNIVRLRNKNIPFRHMNERMDITVFESAVFFKGAIDLDVD